ncbi:MAG TPA: NAD(+) synthase [Clostridiales bacterium]|nr:NAD(+) synthase [Clostridiales bacterium]
MIRERLNIENPQEILDQIEDFIKRSVSRYHKDGCILGISGGLDSALTAYIAVRAVGKENVMGLFMPERDTSKATYADARMLAKILGIPFNEINIKPVVRKMGVYSLQPPAFYVPRGLQEKYVYNKNKKHSKENEPTFLRMLKGGDGDPELQKHMAYLNTKQRIRMTYIYYYAELNNLLVLGNLNKSEYMTGFYVKYGDSASDIQPLIPFYKTQIIQLSKSMMVPDSIINKSPAPDLMPGMNDEEILNISYDSLDVILAGLDMGVDDETMASEAGVDKSNIAYVKRLIELSEVLRRDIDSPNIDLVN